MAAEMFLWRMEWNDDGPFHNGLKFESIQNRILQIGPRVDSCGTTFLNAYAQNSIRPAKVKAFAPFVDRYLYDSDCRFGFNSKDNLELGFEIDEESVQYGNPRYFQQFFQALNQCPEFTIKVYLTTPLASSTAESIFDIKDAVLIETANTYHQFESM